MGKSLIDFKPTLTTANQIRSVTVNGWNRRTGRAISEKVTLDDRDLNRNRDLYELLKKCDPREEVVVEEPVFSPRQSARPGQGDPHGSAKGDGQSQRDYRRSAGSACRKKVQIEGLGARFSGTYFITETTHTIGNNGYTTKFNARREDEKGKE